MNERGCRNEKKGITEKRQEKSDGGSCSGRDREQRTAGICAGGCT